MKERPTLRHMPRQGRGNDEGTPAARPGDQHFLAKEVHFWRHAFEHRALSTILPVPNNRGAEGLKMDPQLVRTARLRP